MRTTGPARPFRETLQCFGARAPPVRRPNGAEENRNASFVTYTLARMQTRSLTPRVPLTRGAAGEAFHENVAECILEHRNAVKTLTRR